MPGLTFLNYGPYPDWSAVESKFRRRHFDSTKNHSITLNRNHFTRVKIQLIDTDFLYHPPCPIWSELSAFLNDMKASGRPKHLRTSWSLQWHIVSIDCNVAMWGKRREANKLQKLSHHFTISYACKMPDDNDTETSWKPSQGILYTGWHRKWRCKTNENAKIKAGPP